MSQKRAEAKWLQSWHSWRFPGKNWANQTRSQKYGSSGSFPVFLVWFMCEVWILKWNMPLQEASLSPSPATWHACVESYPVYRDRQDSSMWFSCVPMCCTLWTSFWVIFCFSEFVQLFNIYSTHSLSSFLVSFLKVNELLISLLVQEDPYQKYQSIVYCLLRGLGLTLLGAFMPCYIKGRSIRGAVYTQNQLQHKLT